MWGNTWCKYGVNLSFIIRQTRYQAERRYDRCGSVSSIDCYCMRIMTSTIQFANCKNTSSEIELEMRVIASIICARNCLYSGPQFSFRQERRRLSVSSKCLSNFSLMTTTVVANAVTEFSFWIEIPYFMRMANLAEIFSRWGRTSSSDAPSMKFVIAEQQ